MHVLARAAIPILAALLCSASAQALTISSGSFGQALGCSSVSCGSTQTLELNPSAAVANATGTLELDSVALTLSFQLNVASLSLTGVDGVPDNGVFEVLFQNTIYQGVALSLLDFGDTYVIGPGQTAAISGIQSQDAAPSGFTALEARVNGSCLRAQAEVVCGISFGQANFNFDVGSSNPEARYFQQTASVIALIEPSTLAVMSLALLGSVVATRRR